MNRWKCPHCGCWTFDEMGKTCFDCQDEEEDMARGPRTRPDAPEGWTTDDWATPQEVFDQIAAVFGPFDLDPAAKPETAKCPVFYTKEENGLTMPWFGKVWVNPPYSDPKPWLAKAVEETRKPEYVRDVRLVVMFIPADISTAWFHQFVRSTASWVPIRGRARFIGWMGTPIGSPKGGNIVAVYPRSEEADVKLASLVETMVLSGPRKRAA